MSMHPIVYLLVHVMEVVRLSEELVVHRYLLAEERHSSKELEFLLDVGDGDFLQYVHADHGVQDMVP